MTITHKIFSGFGVALLLMAIIGTASYRNINNLVQEAVLVAQTQEVLTSLALLLALAADLETGQRGYVITGEERYLQPYTVALGRIEGEQSNLRTLTSDNPTQQARLDSLRVLLDVSRDELQETIDLRQDAGFAAAQEMVLSNIGGATMNVARMVIDDMVAEEQTLLAARQEETDNGVSVTRATILAGFGVTAVLLIVLAVILSMSIGRSFKEREQVLATVTEVSSRLTSASAEILASVTQQATSTEEQAVAVAETMATADEIAQTANQSAEQAKSVADESGRSVELGREGRAVVEETVANMTVVSDQAKSATESIGQLAEKAESIGEIITTVNEIADQSNLLALNAAIEASRAGEHGKGFSVVAGEVKALAEQSKKATGQVRRSLSDIQTASDRAVGMTEQTKTAIDETFDVVKQAGETIVELSDSLGEAAGAAGQISASAAQQLLGIEQISGAVREMNNASTQSQAATVQTKSAAEELNQLAVRLRHLTTNSAEA